MSIPAARFTPLRAWCRTTGPGRVVAILFELEAPASGVGWECQPTNHTGDRHEATRKFGHGDAHRRPRGLARTDFEPRSSVTSRPFRTLHRASGLRGFCAWARSDFSNDAAESRGGTGHAGSGSAPVRSSLGQGLARIHSRARSRRAFASATSEADGAFNQSRNQVRRLMSGGLRASALTHLPEDVGLEDEPKLQSVDLSDRALGPLVDRRWRDAERPGQCGSVTPVSGDRFCLRDGMDVHGAPSVSRLSFFMQAPFHSTVVSWLT